MQAAKIQYAQVVNAFETKITELKERIALLEKSTEPQIIPYQEYSDESEDQQQRIID